MIDRCRLLLIMCGPPLSACQYEAPSPQPESRELRGHCLQASCFHARGGQEAHRHLM